MEYKFGEIEEKWKAFWVENDIYKVTEDSTKPKYYVLDMFPYPSGAALHVGHPLGYVASDIYARYKRLKGFNVLHPMGFDAFGLPAEQYAIETGTHPSIVIQNAIERFRGQMDKIAFSFDWNRMVTTCDPCYYKWTQWIFLKLFGSWYNRRNYEAEPIETLVQLFEKEGCSKKSDLYREGVQEFDAGKWSSLSEAEQQQILMHYRLAFLSYAEVNWCAALGTVLANDEVKDGKSERGGYPIERRKMRQWFLRITEYSDRLLEGLEKLDWSDALKDMQRNWIGRSEGALVNFKIARSVKGLSGTELKVFTTRPDTIFGATFMVIAPEHEWVSQLTTREQRQDIDNYLAYVKSRTDVERQQEKKVTGAFTGSYAINPFTNKEIPIYIAEYVLAGYGTGAIMAVPADDERDHKFAEKFGLPIVNIVDKSMHPGATIEDKIGKMINSGFLNGLEVKDAIKKIIEEIGARGIGNRKVNYKQHDAGFSRQRYWGEPFPIKYKKTQGVGEVEMLPFPLDESQLPLVLPEVSSFKPTADGQPPLANNTEWLENNYELDTMPGYAGSSWYFLRYMDAHNPDAFASKEALNYWKNVDIYFGGTEHAVGHMLYARLWHKVLFDLGYVPTDEPFQKVVNQGMIGGVSALMKVGSGVHFKPVTSEGDNFIEWIEREIGEVRMVFSADFPEEITGKGNRDISLTFSEYHVPVDCIPVERGGLLDEKLDIEKLIQSERGKQFLNACFITTRGYWYYGRFIEFPPELKQGDNTDFLVRRTVEKMSKSKYNTIDPTDVINKYGADCFRLYEMFLGPIEMSKPWDDKGITGVQNFLRKFWKLFYDDKGWKVKDEAPVEAELKILHKTLKKVTEDIERFSYNTCVSTFMIATNELSTLNSSKKQILEPLLIALAPMAPFITEELWSALGHKTSVHQSVFPVANEKYLVETAHNYGVSINGKVRAQIQLPLDIEEAEVKKQVMQLENVQKWTNGAEPKKFIFIKGKIINVVV